MQSAIRLCNTNPWKEEGMFCVQQLCIMNNRHYLSIKGAGLELLQKNLHIHYYGQTWWLLVRLQDSIWHTGNGTRVKSIKRESRSAVELDWQPAWSEATRSKQSSNYGPPVQLAVQLYAVCPGGIHSWYDSIKTHFLLEPVWTLWGCLRCLVLLPTLQWRPTFLDIRMVMHTCLRCDTQSIYRCFTEEHCTLVNTAFQI
jgi:hypothetical protein